MPDQPLKNLRLDNPRTVTFEVNEAARTIKGLALPFGDVGDNGSSKFTFTAGSLTWGKVKVLDGHDWAKAAGTATLDETDEGVVMTAKIARGARGDELLSLAQDGVYDGLSVGLGNDVQADEIDGVYHVKAATVREVSLTPTPAFERAQVTSVAASKSPAAPTKENDMPEKIEEKTTPAQVAFSAEEGTALATKLTELEKKIDGLAEMKAPVTAGPQLAVKEEPIYRFAGTTPAPSGFDFATDLLAAGRDGDAAALERLKKFTAAHLGPRFVATGDVNEVNPSTYRPDMFLGQAPTPTSPLYDTFYVGGLSSVTPFFHSKLDRTATTVAVGNHTEGTDPADTELVTASGATVTPSAVSGKVHITREVADQGGNPQVSGLIWAEFQRSFAISLETKTAALLAAAAGTATALTGTIAAGATGAAAGAAIEAGLIALQFAADGTRFTKLFGHIDLYTALATAINGTTGDRLYPIINPQNRSGIVGAKYSFIDIAGYRMEPGTSLGATSANASNSWVVDPSAVRVWNSGLTRLDRLNESVEGWDLGCFAYFAGLVYDLSGLRKISYDPTA